MVAAAFGTVTAVVLGGVGALLVVAVWMRLFPELARIKGVAPDRADVPILPDGAPEDNGSILGKR